MIARIQIRRDSTVNWNNFNPVLSEAELGVEILSNGDKKIKIGDGVKDWKALDYFSASDVTYSQFMNHINNTVDAHGMDEIKNSVANGLNDANSKIDDHINNTTDAHGINVIKTDVNELETNFANVYQNLTLHINNNTSAHGINNIKDKVDGVESDLNGKINSTNVSLNGHIDDNDAHDLPQIRNDMADLNSKIDDVESDLNGKINATDANLSDHINNDTDAHGIDEIKTDLSEHISDDANAHGIGAIKSSVEYINVEITGLREAIENIDIVSIKGSVDTFADLPDPTNLLDGTAYIVEEDENFNGVTTIYAAINGAWEFIGRFNIDLSNFYMKSEVDALLDEKADRADTYTKTEVNDNFASKTSAIRNDVSSQQNLISPLSMGNNKITDVATPTNNNDAANKKYVDDLIQANIVAPGLVNSPHLWEVGTEYDFGDGSYGRRTTGAITAAANIRNDTVLFSGVNKYIDSGGWFSWSGTGETNSTINLNSTFGNNMATLHIISGLHFSGNVLNFVTISYAARTNSPYDIWVRYTK
jgi:hypothetical protein